MIDLLKYTCKSELDTKGIWSLLPYAGHLNFNPRQWLIKMLFELFYFKVNLKLIYKMVKIVEESRKKRVELFELAWLSYILNGKCLVMV